MLEPFAHWIAETTDDTLILYTDDEAVALWEQRIQEYVKAVNTASS